VAKTKKYSDRYLVRCAGILGSVLTATASFYTPEKERMRQKVNAWILSSEEFDGVVDLHAVVRDPGHPTQLLPNYYSGDHLHPNNAGCRAEGDAFPLALFQSH
jgi:hypothetical protein